MKGYEAKADKMKLSKKQYKNAQIAEIAPSERKFHLRAT